MSTITINSPSGPAATRAVESTEPRFLRTGAASGAIAAAATCLTVVAARAADIDVSVAGEQIPLNGFAMLTLIGALIGVGLAKVFSIRADHPRRTFVRTTVVLTALSIVPDVVADATTATRLVLALTHVVAAAVIVPALAGRLAR